MGRMTRTIGLDKHYSISDHSILVMRPKTLTLTLMQNLNQQCKPCLVFQT